MSDGIPSEGGAGPEGRRERRGTAASPGVGIGPAYVVDERRVHVPHARVDGSELDGEVKRFRNALKLTQEQLEVIKGRLQQGEHRQILKAQQMMLRDPDFSHRTETLIREEAINAEWAVVRVVDEIGETLGQAADVYFRERRSDVTFLGDRVVQNLLGDHPEEIQPPSGCVVVAHDLSPADTAQLARADVVGLVCGAGGRTSHSAIMARSLEIPAVVGVDEVTCGVRTGDMVIIDAIHGVVIVNPDEAERLRWVDEQDKYEAFESRIQRDHALPAIARDGKHVVLRANVSLDEEVASAGFHGAEGIGLYRTEYIFMNRELPPTEEEHYRHAKAVLRRVAPYPVTIRTFDLGADKTSKLVSFEEHEANPAMGLRSLRLALRERDMFLAQLRGLMRAAVHGPLRVMLPLVSGVRELRMAMACVEEARQQLRSAGMAYADDVDVGIMIEIPSAALVADSLAQHVDFISIGTNDLIQYTLAIDRENDHVNYLYQPLHPAILRLVRAVTEAGRMCDIPVSLCGEMAADPRYTWVLVGLGVSELSMHPSAIPVIKSIIRESETEEMVALAERVLACGDDEETERMVLETMGNRFPEHLLHGGAQSAVEADEVAESAVT